jgi:hypothetical protein
VAATTAADRGPGRCRPAAVATRGRDPTGALAAAADQATAAPVADQATAAANAARREPACSGRRECRPPPRTGLPGRRELRTPSPRGMACGVIAA